jgi:hypothetical protein
VIDGVTIDEAAAAGWYNPDNTFAQRAVTAAWRWFGNLG